VTLPVPRRQHLPWKAAGNASERQHSVDEVVRETGWVFNNVTGSELDLASFVETGDHETGAYLQAFGVEVQPLQTIVEIGAGIGRMTASFSRMFDRVIACDLDGAFLERCRETVAQFGRPERLSTVHVADGRTLLIDDEVADLTFSYITLQHCHHGDALELTREAVRVTKPGGHVVLNYRTWVGKDVVLWPASKVVRGLWRVPGVGPVLHRARWSTRLGWQANRIQPDEVLASVGDRLTDVTLFRSPSRRAYSVAGTADGTFEGVNASHWWLVATRV
jgi:ubiquinone/menaquinone biosynthesis C-methylase UbiE